MKTIAFLILVTFGMLNGVHAETICYPVHDRYRSGQIVICREMGWVHRTWKCGVWRECRWRQ